MKKHKLLIDGYKLLPITAAILFVLMNCRYVAAQAYQPIAIENAHWILRGRRTEGNLAHHAFVIRGDTSIDGKDYKKVWFQKLANESFLIEPPYLFGEEHLFGAIRDDSTNRQVFSVVFEEYEFGYACSLFEEQLLFDFSLLPNDTTPQCLHLLPEYPLVIDSVSTEHIFGQDRRVLFSIGTPSIFPDSIFPLYEGIGSLQQGLFASPHTFPSIPEWGVDLVDYCIGLDEDCNILVGTNELPGGYAIKIFPNPASDYLHITTSKPLHTVLIRILDLQGKVVTEFNDVEIEKSHSISLYDLSAGIYFMQILENGNILTTEKLIIQ